jgi:hypothetical protein
MANPKRRTILGIDTNAKTSKGNAYGVLTGIFYGAPARESGYQTCAMASKECAEFCLFGAGMGAFESVKNARVSKTIYFFEERPAFLYNLRKDIAALDRKASKLGLTPAVRLNGTTDIMWERIAPEIFAEFAHIQFYDYTKIPGRQNRSDFPANYHLTFSRSEENDDTGRFAGSVDAELSAGRNVAVVFDVKKGADLPATFKGRPVIDGDVSDIRFRDPAGVVVGLRGKGPAKGQGAARGFVLTVLNGSAD